MTDYGPPSGYSLRRNGTCISSEEKCSNPWGDWYNCCPEGTYCAENNTCCPTEADCSPFIEQDRHCANNETWDMYNSGEGFFCCLSTSYGFLESALEYAGNATTGVGCADGLPDGKTEQAIPPVARGNESESASTSSSATPSPTLSPTPASSPSDTSSESSSGTNTGAIAGGVVGGVAGLALILALVWFLMRRRRLQSQPKVPKELAAPQNKEAAGVFGGELDDRTVISELSGNPNSYAHELPAHYER